MIHDVSSSVIFPLRRSCFLGFHWYVMFLETVGSFHRFLPRLTSRLMRGVLRPWRRPCAVSWRRSWRCRCLRPWRDLMDGWVDFGGSLGWIERLPGSRPLARGGGGKGPGLKPCWGHRGPCWGQVRARARWGVIWSICQGDVRAACSQKWDARKHCKIPGWQGSAHSIVPCLGTCWGHVAEVCLRGRRQGPPGQGHGRWPDFQQTTFWK